MRFWEILIWDRYILLVEWIWILESQNVDYSNCGWWQITPKLHGNDQSFMMITGFIGSRMWTFPSRAGLCSKRMGHWLRDSKAGDCSHLKASSHVWRLIPAVGWGPQLLLMWISLGFLTVWQLGSKAEGTERQPEKIQNPIFLFWASLKICTMSLQPYSQQ